jgi:SAM-dependent methyltransferase
MRPSSVKALMENIGRENIDRARVLEVGCGQGYLVSHFLNLGAQHVIGTDLNREIIESIPRPAFQVYQDRGQTMEFNVEDFQQTRHFENVKIITMFIGIVPLVFRLLDVFVENPHVEIIAFMKPAKQRREIDEKINQLFWYSAIIPMFTMTILAFVAITRVKFLQCVENRAFCVNRMPMSVVMISVTSSISAILVVLRSSI